LMPRSAELVPTMGPDSPVTVGVGFGAAVALCFGGATEGEDEAEIREDELDFDELGDSVWLSRNKGLTTNIVNSRMLIIRIGISAPLFLGGGGGSTGICTPADCPGVGGATGPQALPSQ